MKNKAVKTRSSISITFRSFTDLNCTIFITWVSFRMIDVLIMEHPTKASSNLLVDPTDHNADFHRNSDFLEVGYSIYVISVSVSHSASVTENKRRAEENVCSVVAGLASGSITMSVNLGICIDSVVEHDHKNANFANIFL